MIKKFSEIFLTVPSTKLYFATILTYLNVTEKNNETIFIRPPFFNYVFNVVKIMLNTIRFLAILRTLRFIYYIIDLKPQHITILSLNNIIIIY